jgi:protein gp37
MKDSKIEWTHHTFNPWIGCTRVSPGCTNCYAETMMADRYKKVKWGPQGQRIRTSVDYWKQPLKWNREAAAAGERRRVFCASLADVFESKRDQAIDMRSWRSELFSLIRMTPHLDWLLLTKRPEMIFPIVPWFITEIEKYPNVWIGTSVENQEYADKRIPELLKIPAAVRFLSVEPLLGPVVMPFYDEGWYDEGSWITNKPTCKRLGYSNEPDNHINWVIVGGESGPGARPMDANWVRSLRDQCQKADVPFFFKQWGGVNKKNTGRVLDFREWNEIPHSKVQQ